MDQKAIYQELEKKGVNPSLQRYLIYKFLWENRIHPNVDDIYERLLPDMPTLSRTTVYNTVNLFAEMGILTPLTIEEKEIRYDIDTSDHGHFKCEKCGRVYDFQAVMPGLPSELEGFSIKQRELSYRGVCKNCL